MANKNKYSINKIDENLKINVNHFLSNIESDMLYKSNYYGDLLDFDWLDEIEKACPHIDTIVRNPKLTLIKEEEVVKMEKAKVITVETIKDLAKHTNYIDKFDTSKDKVEPKKVLMVHSEETFNIYENRFLYTLIDCIDRFVAKKENDFKSVNDLNDTKFIEYSGNSKTETEKIHIDLKITSDIINVDNINDNVKKEIKDALKRIKRIKEYLGSWRKSAMYQELEKQHVSLIQPPIKKTNIILKNPNFGIATKLWDYLRKYDLEDYSEERLRNDIEREKNDLKSLIDHSFFINFCVLSSISKYKKEQRQKICDHAVVLLTEEIRNVISILQNNGYEITDEEILQMMAKEIKKKPVSSRLAGMEDVKNKFKTAMDEYLERTQDYL
ncbi:MAG: DUF2357 domain-containing protein [Bacilli bacterium]